MVIAEKIIQIARGGVREGYWISMDIEEMKEHDPWKLSNLKQIGNTFRNTFIETHSNF